MNYDLFRVIVAANLILQTFIMVTIKGWTPMTVVQLVVAVFAASYVSDVAQRMEEKT